MFEIHIGTTPCQLEREDYRTLADETDGYSGSDIATVVHDALMQPIRKIMGATHFKRVPDPTKQSNDLTMWTPCSPGNPDAVEKNWQDVGTDELLEPPLRVGDFLKSLESTRKTVSESDIKKHDEWTKESGGCLSLYCCLSDADFLCRSGRRVDIIFPTVNYTSFNCFSEFET